MRATFKTAAIMATLANLGVLCGCTVAQGAFDEVTWSPITTAFAVADRHDLVVRQGTVVATRRTESAQTLTLVFSESQAPVGEEWAQMPHRRLLDLRHNLAETDGLLIDNLPLAEIKAGASFESEWQGPGYNDDTFVAGVVMRTSVALRDDVPALGSRFIVKVDISEADAKAEGFIAGRVEVTRARGDNQEDDVAGGTVGVDFRVPVASERRGKANLAIARPVLACAALRGPTRAAGCHDEDAEDLLDATGLTAAGSIAEAESE